MVEDAKSYDEIPKTIVDIGIPYVNPDKSFTRNLSSRPHEPKGRSCQATGRDGGDPGMVVGYPLLRKTSLKPSDNLNIDKLGLSA